MTLVRFRADPAKVRVSIRRVPDGWMATVGNEIESVRIVSAWSSSAVIDALYGAEEAAIDGIDLDCDWAYEHPFK